MKLRILEPVVFSRCLVWNYLQPMNLAYLFYRSVSKSYKDVKLNFTVFAEVFVSRRIS